MRASPLNAIAEFIALSFYSLIRDLAVDEYMLF